MKLRRRLILIGAVVLALAGLAGREVYWAYHARPGAPGGGLAAVRALVEKDVPSAGMNGWPALVAVLKKLHDAVPVPLEPWPEWPKDLAWPPDPAEIGRVSPKPEVEAFTRRALQQARDAGVFEGADALAGAGYFRRELESPTGNLIDVTLPELPDLRLLGRLQVARMSLAFRAGDGAERLRAYESVLVLVRALDQQATLIDRLFADQILTAAEQELRAELVERSPGDEGLAAIQAARARQLPKRPTIARVMECERQTTLDIIRMCYTDDGRGDGRLIVTELRRVTGAGDPTHPPPAHPLTNLRGIIEPGKAETVAKANWLYDELVAAIAKPLPARHVFVQGLESRVVGLERTGERVLSALMPAMGHAVVTDDRARGEWDATSILLAIERYRAANGAPPEDLSQLVPGQMAVIPADSITGAAYGYFVPKSGTPAYVLYSYGTDGVDNDGKTNPADPWAGYSNSAQDLDIVYTLPRR